MSDDDPSVQRSQHQMKSATQNAPRPRVGIYGGTFNPVHLGHLRAAEEVREQLDLERIVFVPSASPPHKLAGSGADAIAPALDRLEWLRRATSDNPHFEVNPIEIERGGASFTVDTLREFAVRMSGELPVFVIGRDAFLELGTWREPEALLELSHFAVTTRPATGEEDRSRLEGTCSEALSQTVSETLSDWLPDALRKRVALAADGQSGRHRERATWIRHIEITALDISASAVRQRLRAGQSIRYLVSESIREAVSACPSYAPLSAAYIRNREPAAGGGQ